MALCRHGFFLYSDTNWNDRKYLCLLSPLIILVTIEQADEEDRQGQVHIELSYRLMRVYSTNDGTKQHMDHFL